PDGPLPLVVEPHGPLTPQRPGEELLEPFDLDGAGDPDAGLERTAPAVLARVEGEEELGVAHDRGRVEPDAPPADHHAGGLAPPAADDPVGVREQDPAEHRGLVGLGLASVAAAVTAAGESTRDPGQFIPRPSRAARGVGVDPARP